MNKITLMTVVVAALFSTALVHAKDTSEPEGKNVQAEQKAPDVSGFDKQMAQAQENFRKLQEEMDKIRQTQDPVERKKLLQEHWTTMQNTMGAMQGMWNSGGMGWPMMNGSMMGGRMMMGGMMGWKGMSGYYSKLTPEQVKQRQYMMDQYMGMQQMMMNHMMMNQSFIWAQPSP
jgi:hypothetical protein